MSARKARGDDRLISGALRQKLINHLKHKVDDLEKENAEISQTLSDSTRDLKQMCDLCDKQRAEIDDRQKHINAYTQEITHLNSLIRLLVAGASA